LISTGSLTDSFGEEKTGAIDFVFATYWFFPAKTTVVLPEDQACIDRKMSQEEDRFNTSSKYRVRICLSDLNLDLMFYLERSLLWNGP
jgi:hypothetical protein